MIRDAKFEDVPRMATILQDFYQRSIYASRGNFDRTNAKRLLAMSLQRHGHKNRGGSFVQVAVPKEGAPAEGFIVGLLEPVYQVLDTFTATDLFFPCTEQMPPRDAYRLLEAFVNWADSVPRVIEIRMGVTNAMGDWKASEPLYRSLGFEHAGVMYERRVER